MAQEMNLRINNPPIHSSQQLYLISYGRPLKIFEVATVRTLDSLSTSLLRVDDFFAEVLWSTLPFQILRRVDARLGK
jgi:hypothetical protein